MLDRLEFLFTEGFTAFRRNGWMTFAAISTAAIALFLIGGLSYIFVSLTESVASMSGRYTMRAYLRDGTDYKGIRLTAAAMRAIPGVGTVVWIPKEKAWVREQSENPNLTAGISNPYPDGFRIQIKDLGKANSIIAQIKEIPSVDKEEGVHYMAGELVMLTQGLDFIRVIGFPLAALCLATAGVLIYNAIRLTVVARRREIRVMQLVGASYATIRIPFLLEGCLQGIFGGALGTVLLWASHRGVLAMIADYKALGTIGAFPIWNALGAMAAAGAAYGFVCSGLAVRSPLKLGASPA